MKDNIIAGPFQKENVELFKYISLNTNKDSIIIFYKPRIMTLFTNRKSARITKFDKIKKSGADYVVCRKNSKVDLEIQKFTQRVNKIFVNNTFNLYRLNKKTNRSFPPIGLYFPAR